MALLFVRSSWKQIKTYFNRERERERERERTNLRPSQSHHLRLDLVLCECESEEIKDNLNYKTNPKQRSFVIIRIEKNKNAHTRGQAWVKRVPLQLCWLEIENFGFKKIKPKKWTSRSIRFNGFFFCP